MQSIERFSVMDKESSQCGYSPKAFIATLHWKAMCGESRTHSLEGVVEGRPSATTLQRRMWAFEMINVCSALGNLGH